MPPRFLDKTARCLLLGIGILSACAPAPIAPTSQPSPVVLTAYAPPAPTATPELVEENLAELPPEPTATPRTHTIKKGEDLGGIAYAYQVSLTALMAANPDVNTYALSVGQVLVIPPSSEASSESEGDEGIPSPTPVMLEVDSPKCYASSDGGVWCFSMVHNSSQSPVEGVTARVRLTGKSEDNILTATAATPLNLLLAGGKLPLSVYFPAPAPTGSLRASIQLLTGLPSAGQEDNYLPLGVELTRTEIAANGLSAAATINLILKKGDSKETEVWLVVTAFDASGKIVGMRKYVENAKLATDNPKIIQAQVFSSGDRIESLDVVAEARK
jgi:LysM repeat protein